MRTGEKFWVKRKKGWKDSIGLVARVNEVAFGYVLLTVC